ncbi:MAG: ABC transporter substrate-binding protein [Propionibacteriaceae bacterium]
MPPLHPPVDQFTRRSFLLTAAVSGLALTAGCGAGSAESMGTPPSPSGSPTDQRIVTMDPFSTYNALDFGLVPVGAQEGLEGVINPRYADTYAELAKVGTYFEPNLEAIAGLAPDLILASTGQRELEDQLTALAPTVLVTATVSSTWRQAAAEVAAEVGRQREHDTLQQAYLDRAAEIKEARADVLADLTWAMVWQGKAEGFSVRSAESNGGQVLELAGVRYNALTGRADGDSDTELSWEQVDEIADADVICLPGTTTGDPDPGTELIKEHELFATLPAVQAERVVVFDYMTPGSYINATQLLDELDGFLATLA